MSADGRVVDLTKPVWAIATCYSCGAPLNRPLPDHAGCVDENGSLWVTTEWVNVQDY